MKVAMLSMLVVVCILLVAFGLAIMSQDPNVCGAR